MLILKIFVEIVMMVFIPMWFEIEGNPYVQIDARHLYKTAKFMKEQSIDAQKIVAPVRNEMDTSLILGIFCSP